MTNDPLKAEIEAALTDVNLQSLDPSDTGSPTTTKESGQRDRNLHRGTIAGISNGEVIVELGPRMQGAIALTEFDEAPKIGDTFEFSLNGQSEDGLWNLSRREAKILAAWDDLSVGAMVKCTVQGSNKGGLDMNIGPIRAFMPASHASLVRVENLDSLTGQSMVCEVVELDLGKKRVVVSRRKVLAAEREEARSEAMGRLVPGATVSGTVTRVETFGVFVDIGGIEGLVHVSNLSRKRVEDPNEFTKKGEQVQVMILEIKEGGKRIGLGMKQLEPDPWDDIEYQLQPDQTLEAKVVRVLDFGAFLEVLPGVEGLLHASQLVPNTRVDRAQDHVKEGEELSVRVVSIDKAQQRLSLSRLDSRGALIGSEDAVDSSTIDNVIAEGQNAASTNLGSLFKRAMGGN